MKFHCFYKTAIQKDDREPTFPHYRIRTIDWSQLILINIKHEQQKVINSLGYVFHTVSAACVDKLEEKIHLWRSFLSFLALSRRTFSASGGGEESAFAPIAPPPAYAPDIGQYLQVSSCTWFV